MVVSYIKLCAHRPEFVAAGVRSLGFLDRFGHGVRIEETSFRQFMPLPTASDYDWTVLAPFLSGASAGQSLQQNP